jgi:hypothetical protein
MSFAYGNPLRGTYRILAGIIVLALRGVNAGGNGNHNARVLLFLRRLWRECVCGGVVGDATAATFQDVKDKTQRH